MSNYPSGYQEPPSIDDYVDSATKHLSDEIEALKAIIEKQSEFIKALMPLIEAEHDAQHMLDGFRPQERPIDKLLADAKNLIEIMGDGGGDGS